MASIESVIQELIDECNGDRSEIARLQYDVNGVTAACIDAGLTVEGPDVRPVLQAAVAAELVEREDE